MAEDPINKGGRPRKRSGADPYTNNQKVSAEAATALVPHAKKLGMGKGEFTSAAILYFTSNGLDPRQADGLLEGHKTRSKLTDVSLEVRKYVAEVGNRIVTIQRGVERELFRFMEAEHHATINYLGQIERNILEHQVALDTKVLTPLLENLVGGNVETHLVRVLIEILLLKTKEPKHSVEELRGTTIGYDKQLETRRIPEMRRVLEAASVPTPQLTTKPIAPKPVIGTNGNATKKPDTAKPES